MLRRFVDFIATAVRQAVPIGGIFGLGWQPATAIAVYGLESALLAGIAVAACFQLRSRTSAAAIAQSRAAGDLAHAEALQAAQHASRTAGVNPHDVLLFHGSSLAVFGVFFAAILLMMARKGGLAEAFDLAELRHGATTMAIVVASGFALEQLMVPEPGVSAVQSRVNACLGRWSLLWLLGFGGTAMLAFTDRPQRFFQLFAVLTLTWEAWGALARVFGWTSLQDGERARVG